MLVVRYASLWLGVTMMLQAVQFSLHAYYLVMERPHDLLHAWVNNLNDWSASLIASSSATVAGDPPPQALTPARPPSVRRSVSSKLRRRVLRFSRLR